MARHHQPRLLTARQHATDLVDIVAREAEAAGEVAQRAATRERKRFLQRLQHGLLRLQHFHGVLREVPRRTPAPEPDQAGVRRGLAGDQLSKVDLRRR